jgi:uncharacterized protein
MSDATPQASVEERLRNDLKEATRQRDQVRMDTIRMALAAFRNEEVSGSRHELSEQERHAILDKLVKQRHESAELFEKEEREAAMLAAYLPQS